MGSAGLYIAAVLIFALGAAAGVSFSLYQRRGSGETSGLFAPRSRRLAFVERASLDGGRRLLLVRRDDVEHLVLVGGPIDLVVETGIRSEATASVFAKEAVYEASADPVASAWQTFGAASAKSVEPAEPRLPLSPEVKPEDVIPVLAPMPEQEAKAAAE